MKDKLYSNRITLLKAGALGLLPLLCCVVACAMQGKSIFDIYLPASEWNDELFYFKQVEAMLSNGYPRGYFGFNESHALKLSFAAWSPVLVWPWLLWGLLFGWNLTSPILCNIAVMTVAVVAFALLVKPGWKQTGLLALLFCTFTPFVNYMLRGMPEASCFAMVIVYYALFLRQQEKEDVLSLVLLFVFAGVMTLMRPYLVLFYIYPMYRWIRRQRWIGVLGSVLSLGVVLGGYFAIKHYLGAEYFTPLFQTEWLTPFTEGHIWQGIKGTVSKLFSNGGRFVALTKEGFISGLAEGAYFGGYIAMLMLFVWQMLYALRKKDKKRVLEYAYVAFCYVGMLIALLLMYKMKEGSKHLITFMAMGVFVVAMMETKLYKKAVFLGVICVYLYSVKATSEMDYALPFANDERVEQMEYWEAAFDSELVLSESEDISYENTVIWVFADEVRYENVLTDWQILYALPEGFGISCCYSDYALENFDNLKSKYMTIPAGSTLEQMCLDAGYTQIGTDGRVAVYEVNKTYEQLLGEMHSEIEDRGANALFLSSIPLSYDMEEDFWNYCLLNAVQGDFSMASYEDFYYATEELLNSHAIDTLYMYLDVNLFAPESGVSELFYELFENTTGIAKRVMLYAPSLDTMASLSEEEREWYYSLVQQTVGRLSVENTKVHFAGAQEWLVGNEKNYRGDGVIERKFFKSFLFDMFYNDKYVMTAENVVDTVVHMNNLVEERINGTAYYDVEPRVYVFMGDSIFGNTTDSTSVSEVVSSYAGVEVFNIAVGGSQASVSDSDVASGIQMVENFITNTDNMLEKNEFASDEIQRWHSIYETSTDGMQPVFFLNYGLNDYMNGSPLLGDSVEAYEGALRHIIRTIRENYETADIVLLTPSYISYYDHGTAVVNEEGAVLKDYVEMMKALAKQENTYLFDVYGELGIEAANADEYLADKIHHNEKGRLIYGKYICEKMEALRYE